LSSKEEEYMKKVREILDEATWKIQDWSKFLKDIWSHRLEEHIASIRSSVSNGNLVNAVILCITLQQKAELIHLTTQTVVGEWVRVIKEAMKKLEELR